jgi:phosphatidylglycerophosphatase A
VAVVNTVREELGEQFDTTVGRVDEAAYLAAVDEVFADGDLAVNVAALVRLLRELDVSDDYPGFVIDELLGRELAAMLAGTQPLRLLGEATFHYADVVTEGDAGETAGADDLTAALAAGFQTRLPGWDWRDGESPFTVG